MAEPTKPAAGVAAAEPEAQPQARPARLGLRASAALALVALVTIGGLGFAAGRLTGPGSTQATGSPTCSGYAYRVGGNVVCMDQDGMGHRGVWMPGGMRGGMVGGISGYAGVVTGTVQAVDSSSITIQVAGGRTVQIALGKDTVYRTAGSSSPASAADVKVGATVAVRLTGGRTPTAGQVTIRNP
jgi:hypothetical protein